MLVLKLRRGQTVKIGPDITVTVVVIAGRRPAWIEVGIEAPSNWLIGRQDLPAADRVPNDNSPDAENLLSTNSAG